jgi:hypothetical protein
MKPKTYEVLMMCLENGLLSGWNRAHKHNTSPARDTIIAAQWEAVRTELFEWFDFEREDNGTV